MYSRSSFTISSSLYFQGVAGELGIMLVILKVKFVSLIGGGRFLPPPIISEYGYLVNLFGRKLEVSIHLVIQFQECLLGFIVKAVDANLDCLCLVLENAVGTDNVDQAAGANNFLNTTVIEGLADNITPVHQSLTEVCVAHTKRLGNILNYSDFLRRGRICLLKGHRETLKECFIENIGADKAS